ncbi:uncharacterized protein LOC142973878 [Anticarsia gemmatalis]|uniref:uncharacterized protein LOC142973878 n=1 Tax=Anticarsia gemmatalis TaxID=129554 RepID=UPI003F776C57
MKDSQTLMVRFCRIVERHPEVYDHNLAGYKTRQVDTEWEKIADCVRSELKEECTIEELKIKWKGIRSSFNRYKNKLITATEPKRCKKYYLYDTLHFLDPFTRPKGFSGKKAEDSFYNEGVVVSDDESKGSNDNNSVDEWNISEIKPDITVKEIIPETIMPQKRSNSSNPCPNCENAKKRRFAPDEENEDLQFFRSVIPEIKDFTNKEKRKFKMGVLKLIDDIESERDDEQSA